MQWQILLLPILVVIFKQCVLSESTVELSSSVRLLSGTRLVSNTDPTIRNLSNTA